jgi:U3 small nucleolar RNA-associated protein 18
MNKKINYHPKSYILLCADTNNSINLFQMDEEENKLIEEYKDIKFVHDVKFSKDGNEILLTKNRESLISIDIIKGEKKFSEFPDSNSQKSKNYLKDFEISPDNSFIALCTNDRYVKICSTKTKFFINEFRLNNNVQSVAFTSDSKYLFTSDDAGIIYAWDMRTRKLLYSHEDEGAMNTTSIAVSNDMKYYSSGSVSGVVNVYKNPMSEKKKIEKPFRVLKNIRTGISKVQFSNDSKMMVMNSVDENNSLRMVFFFI